jgi:type IV secretory pathway VirB10-like protein
MRRSALAALLACALCAQAQVLFKWIDAEGKTHYGDRVPKGFAGKVERIEPPEPAQPAAVPTPAAAPKPLPAASEPSKAAPPPVDYAKRRRETRERLRADIVAAEERLEQAKARLSGGEATNDDERQVIQQIANRPGSLPAAGRSNCRKGVGADGKAVVMCPAVIPNEAYYERIKGLEEAVKAAEADLDRAKEAYRRGVD